MEGELDDAGRQVIFRLGNVALEELDEVRHEDDRRFVAKGLDELCEDDGNGSAASLSLSVTRVVDGRASRGQERLGEGYIEGLVSRQRVGSLGDTALSAHIVSKPKLTFALPVSGCRQTLRPGTR